MPVHITIRNVPEEVRDELATRAARNRQSMQAYLLDELERIASKPSKEEWLNAVRRHNAASGRHIPASVILDAIHADRK